MISRVILTLIYFLPSIIALAKDHNKKLPITIGNILFGWTGIGWLVFLAIAFDLKSGSKGSGQLVKIEDDNVDRSKPIIDEEEIESEYPEVKQLDAILREIRMKAGVEVRGQSTQALSQLKILVKRFEGVISILGAKLSKTEITYTRYYDASFNVFNSIIVNLSIISSLMNSVDGINSEHIERRLESLEKLLQKHDADLEEMQTLEERKELISSQLQKINVLLTKNEVALTKLDKLNAALAEMNIVSGKVPSEFNSAISQMENLVERVKLYDESPVEWEPKKKENKDKIKS